MTHNRSAGPWANRCFAGADQSTHWGPVCLLIPISDRRPPVLSFSLFVELRSRGGLGWWPLIRGSVLMTLPTSCFLSLARRSGRICVPHVCIASVRSKLQDIRPRGPSSSATALGTMPGRCAISSINVGEAVGPARPGLGGHFKTGHRWAGQNRPTGGRPGLSCFTLPAPHLASRFSFASFAGRISADVHGEAGGRAWR